MHPDQKTPEQDQQLPPAAEAEAEAQETNVRTPEPEGKRLGEAGHAYTGRQMDDALKSSPRVDDADEVEADDADEA